MRAVLAAHEHIAGAVVGARVEDLARQRLVVGDGVGVDRLAEDQVAAPWSSSPTAVSRWTSSQSSRSRTPSRSARARASSTSKPGRSSFARGIGQVGGVHAHDQLAALADPPPGLGRRIRRPARRRERGLIRHAELGVDLPELAGLGEPGQGPVDLHQELRILGPHGEGHVPALAGHVFGHEPQAKLRVLVQVPGGEVRVEQGGVQPGAVEPVEHFLAGLEPSDRVVFLRDGDRPGHEPDPLPAEVGQGRDPSDVARDHQPESGPGIRDAPGDAARRPGVERLAGDDVAAALGQAMPGALGAAAPVELDRPAQGAAQPLGDGHVQAPGLAVRGPLHPGRGSGDRADDQRLQAG